MSLPALHSLNARRYAETFSVFLRHSQEYALMTHEIERVIQSRLPSNIRMLDIGAGTGCVIESLAQQPSLTLACYEAFEPNPSHVAALTPVLAKCTCPTRLHAMGFEETTQVDGRFDFVLFSHSLYWMPNPAAVMLHAAGSLSTDGVVMALIQGPYGAHALFNLFENQYLRTTPMLQNNRMSSHELVLGLRNLGVEPEVHILKTPIDLTGLFEAEGREELGEFISFLLQLEFNHLPERLQRDIIQHIEGGCVEMDRQLLWFLPNASVVFSATALS